MNIYERIEYLEALRQQAQQFPKTADRAAFLKAHGFSFWSLGCESTRLRRFVALSADERSALIAEYEREMKEALEDGWTESTVCHWKRWIWELKSLD